ncbi:substrate-binding domain-containing protein [Streptomyces sp. SID8379]|uniref:LacI family DNA-binding transcriptional regulator n=1 Tax=unclassified Streptomyces TaxID=2593676 RepID=UPI000996F51B|nr:MULTISPECIES: LacI family DNA-binding transcriptional regulator [unclassified Streptomyces]MYW70423.1 substrate-binding domain-containing protein [Streptomyces sp. SID8379]
MTASGRITIRDVAARAQMSPATVSRVLSGNHPVPPTTRARVLEAAHALDYVANTHARALVGVGRGSVGVVLRHVTHPFSAQVAEAAEAEAARHGRLCLIASTDGNPRREADFIRLMREEGAQAVILVGGATDDHAYRRRIAHYAHALQSIGSRLVLCGRPSPDPELPVSVVEYDNAGGTRAITGHLLSAGHERIVFCGGVPGNTVLDARVAGYRAALAAHGLPPDTASVINCGGGRTQGYLAISERLARQPDFTAVVAGDDLGAAGAVRAVTDHGLRVPHDISVVGFDDIPLAQDLSPALTTVHTPTEDLGRAAVQLAIDPTAPALMLPTSVILRDSVSPRRVHPSRAADDQQQLPPSALLTSEGDIPA